MRNIGDYIITSLALAVTGVSAYYGIWSLAILLGGIVSAVVIINLLFRWRSTENIIAINQGKSGQEEIWVRKYKQADVEQYLGTFFRIGLIISLLTVLFAFNFEIDMNDDLNICKLPISYDDDIGEIIPPIIYPEEPKKIELPVEKPTVKAPIELATIKQVNDTEIIEEKIETLEKWIEDKPIVTPSEIEFDIDWGEIDGEDKIKEKPLPIITFAEEMPRFASKCETKKTTLEDKTKCAEKALLTFVHSNIKYPRYDKEMNIDGKVFVSFVVETNGQISNIKIVREPQGGTLGKEVIRIIKSMPNWIPGKQNGKAARVKYNIPVDFQLTN